MPGCRQINTIDTHVKKRDGNTHTQAYSQTFDSTSTTVQQARNIFVRAWN